VSVDRERGEVVLRIPRDQPGLDGSAAWEHDAHAASDYVRIRHDQSVGAPEHA
jgi:hypothetical protein